MALSEKHKAVANEYLKCFNRSEAYRAVYPSVATDTAASNAWRLWQNPEMQEYISRRLSETAMSADEVLMRLGEQARGDIGEYLRHDPNTDDVLINLPRAMEAQKTRLIKKLTQKRTTRTMKDDSEIEEVTTSIEMYDAQAALGMIGKKHGLFVDRSENRNYDIDLSKLTNEQLERVAAGEDPLQVVLDGYVSAG